MANLDFTGSGERIVTAVRVRPMSIREHKDRSRPIILVDEEDESKSSEVVLLDPTYFSRKRDYERSFMSVYSDMTTVSCQTPHKRKSSMP